MLCNPNRNEDLLCRTIQFWIHPDQLRYRGAKSQASKNRGHDRQDPTLPKSIPPSTDKMIESRTYPNHRSNAKNRETSAPRSLTIAGWNSVPSTNSRLASPSYAHNGHLPIQTRNLAQHFVRRASAQAIPNPSESVAHQIRPMHVSLSSLAAAPRTYCSVKSKKPLT